jgi:hypothetical protein
MDDKRNTLRLVARFRAGQCPAVFDDYAPSKPQRRTQQTRVKDLLPKAFPPDGHPPDDATLLGIQNRLRPLMKKGSKIPSTDTIARALGRRDRRA